ncbi:hypothetical protein ACN3XK_27830 [Actinomadura welshii]
MRIDATLLTAMLSALANLILVGVTARQVFLTREALYSSAQPYVIADIQWGPTASSPAQLLLRNVGNAVARKVEGQVSFQAHLGHPAGGDYSVAVFIPLLGVGDTKPVRLPEGGSGRPLTGDELKEVFFSITVSLKIDTQFDRQIKVADVYVL